jgi:hypothetical protein
VEQKSSIKVQHAQQATELTGGIKREAVLEMGYSFLQWSGTLREHLVTKEGDLGCSEDALRRVDQDPVCLKPVEQSS